MIFLLKKNLIFLLGKKLIFLLGQKWFSYCNTNIWFSYWDFFYIFLLGKKRIFLLEKKWYSYWENYFPTGKKIDIPTGKNKLFSYWKKIYLIFLINSVVCFLVCLPCHNLQLDPYSTFIKFNLADSSRREILHLK